MRKLILLYFIFLGLGIAQAQTVLPIKPKTYTFGLLKNYYQDMNKIAKIPGFQLSIEKKERLIVYQFLPAQLIDQEIDNMCDYIGVPFARIYNSFSYNFFIVNKPAISLSSGPVGRLIVGLYYPFCWDNGFWREPVEKLYLRFEPGLNTCLLYFPFSSKKLSKIGFSANINLMAFGANTYQMGICYKHISKKPFKK